MTGLVDKILRCHSALTESQIPHAFGGALALAWCTQQARGTVDIDINLFVGAEGIVPAMQALPPEIGRSGEDLECLRRDLQHRLWWGHTPVNLFFNSSPYHERLNERVRWERFTDRPFPFLSCIDLAVFKAFFNRTKDWADLKAMRNAGTLDFSHVAATIVELLGVDDPRLAKLEALRPS